LALPRPLIAMGGDEDMLSRERIVCMNREIQVISRQELRTAAMRMSVWIEIHEVKSRKGIPPPIVTRFLRSLHVCWAVQ
jgi:hypothetical protein